MTIKTSTVYKLNVSSPWRLHRSRQWHWMPRRYETGFDTGIYWLCFLLERHVIGHTVWKRESSPVPLPGFERVAVQGATLYYEWERLTPSFEQSQQCGGRK